MMEEGFFRNKPADYVWLMVFSASVLLAISIIVPFASLPFMGSALSFTMVYIWARRNPYVRLNFLGLLVFTAPYLPWVLLIFSLCLGGQIPTGDILGVLVGHIYYFFEDVWPQDPVSQGKKWLATPRVIRWLVEGNRPRDDSIDIAMDPVEGQVEEEEANVSDLATGTVAGEQPLPDGHQQGQEDEMSGNQKTEQQQTHTTSAEPSSTKSPSTSASISPISSPKQATSSYSNELPSI
ncbi:hypothetical protein [Parasitella parasitica]|uniref:Derlin n=1 Tax=Parasitella parasitica TaxID=35722 RepID=A0A0B7NSF3_9FUNG|nr:hypothetical protein [Parasitella parasitica]